MKRWIPFMAAMALTIVGALPVHAQLSGKPQDDSRRGELLNSAGRNESATPELQEAADLDSAGDAESDPRESATPTLGGKQFWADELLFHDWRIQRNVFTGHCRLLDGENRRYVSGGFEFCRRELERLKQERNLPPMKSKVVIVLHGIWGTRTRMEQMTEYLRQESDFEVLSAAYPSTRATLNSHAESLGRILENLEGVEEVSFVAHSLGNLVIRRYLAEMKDAPEDQVPRAGLSRIVMLGPPNRGALLAAKFKDNKLFQSLWGPSGVLLAADWDDVEDELALPPCSFGIIAGGRGDELGFNPLLDGDDDFVVRVDETRLPGAADFLVVPVLHSSLMNDQRVQVATLRFLEQGCFISEAARQPIPAP